MEFKELSRQELQSDHQGVIRRILRFLSRNFFKLTTLILASTTLAAGLLAYKFYGQITLPEEQKVEQSTTSSIDVNDKTKLGEIRTAFEKVAVVPVGEEPSIGQIMDPDQLRTQNPTFYADAKVGDALFIYTKKAYIFRPSENKVVNVAPVTRQADKQK